LTILFPKTRNSPFLETVVESIAGSVIMESDTSSLLQLNVMTPISKQMNIFLCIIKYVVIRKIIYK